MKASIITKNNKKYSYNCIRAEFIGVEPVRKIAIILKDSAIKFNARNISSMKIQNQDQTYLWQDQEWRSNDIKYGQERLTKK